MAKALGWNALDGEGRKPGERTGLDTRVGSAVGTAPESPGCKRCGLGVGWAWSPPSAAGKPLSPPPGEYGRKAET